MSQQQCLLVEGGLRGALPKLGLLVLLSKENLLHTMHTKTGHATVTELSTPLRQLQSIAYIKLDRRPIIVSSWC